jgi:hypothetical protein
MGLIIGLYLQKAELRTKALPILYDLQKKGNRYTTAILNVRIF